MVKPPGRPNLALADFTAPRETGVEDYVGAFAVTAGHGLDEVVAAFEADHDDYSSILAKALADRLAEAFAERLHELVRRELWGYSPHEHLPNDAIIREDTRASGRRRATRPARTTPRRARCSSCSRRRSGPASGSPSRSRCGRAPRSAATTSGIPQAHYFGLGRIGPDQLADYAERKGIDVETMARWLAPNLADA